MKSKFEAGDIAFVVNAPHGPLILALVQEMMSDTCARVCTFRDGKSFFCDVRVLIPVIRE